jgi:hypothetical protein
MPLSNSNSPLHDLLLFCHEIAGFQPPPDVTDTQSAEALKQGAWLARVEAGDGRIPYVGELAHTHSFIGFKALFARLVMKSQADPAFTGGIRPFLANLFLTLQLLPDYGSTEVDSLRQRLSLLMERARLNRPPATKYIKADVTDQFQFPAPFQEGAYHYVEANGRLGVPGKVKQQRDRNSQRRVSRRTGDDAGHLIGNQFGGPGGVENLTAQNKIANENGTFHALEDRWAEKLKNSIGIEVVVQDVFRDNEDRPFMRRAAWNEILVDGAILKDELVFANTHTPGSRKWREIAPTVPDDNVGKLIPVDFRLRRRLS